MNAAAHPLHMQAPEGVRVPPHSENAEQSVLGGLLLDNSALAAAAEVVTGGDFYVYKNRLIYAAIGALIADSKPADLTMVFEQLQGLGKAEECGGLAYLNALTQSVTSVVNMRRWAEAVRECSTKRKLIAAAEEIITSAFDSKGRTSAAIASGGIERLNAIATTVAAPLDPMAALARWAVTDEQVHQMKETRVVWRSLIAEGHVAAWCAPPNGGKTRLALFAAGELTAAGFKVLFFQEDAGAGDLIGLHEHARRHGYTLLNSTLSNSTPLEQLSTLNALAKSGSSLSGYVMFFDTLKKYADLMSKGGAREFFRLMRALTQRGATIVLLGHTNKHRGIDGKLIFEGVGDVRADVDELLYIEASEKTPAGVVTLTVKPDKVRALLREASFELDTQAMKLTPLDHVVDVAAQAKAAAQRAEDADLIAAISAALASGGMKHAELVAAVQRATSCGASKVRTVIDAYSALNPTDPDALWCETRLALHNTRYFSIPPRQ